MSTSLCPKGYGLCPKGYGKGIFHRVANNPDCREAALRFATRASQPEPPVVRSTERSPTALSVQHRPGFSDDCPRLPTMLSQATFTHKFRPELERRIVQAHRIPPTEYRACRVDSAIEDAAQRPFRAVAISRCETDLGPHRAYATGGLPARRATTFWKRPPKYVSLRQLKRPASRPASRPTSLAKSMISLSQRPLA